MQDEGALLCAFDLHACIGPFSIHRAAVITRIQTFHPIANSIQLLISQSNRGTDSDARSPMKRHHSEPGSGIRLGVVLNFAWLRSSS